MSNEINQRLDDIRARLDALEPGNWRQDPDKKQVEREFTVHTNNGRKCKPRQVWEPLLTTYLVTGEAVDPGEVTFDESADAELVGNAPSDLEWCLAHIEQLEKAVGECGDRCGWAFTSTY